MEPQTHAPDPTHAHKGPDLGAYLTVFFVLCILTAVSFVVNYLLGQNQTSMLIILGVAVVKALCVAAIFMHLVTDWGKLYFIIIPVTIMGIMMMIVLLPDIVLVWHHE